MEIESYIKLFINEPSTDAQFKTINTILRSKSGQFKYAANLNTEFSSPHDGTSSSSDYIVSVSDFL